jgi:hypothetical protein
MLNAHRIHFPKLSVPFIVAIAVGVGRPAAAQDTLRVYNNMSGVVKFWLLSEQDIPRGGQYQGWWVRKGETKPIPLNNGLDRFYQSVTDTEGNQFDNDPLPLRQMLRQDPNMTLTLDGELKTVYLTRSEWDPFWRRWIRVARPVQIRTATIYTFKFSNGTSKTYRAGAKPN